MQVLCIAMIEMHLPRHSPRTGLYGCMAFKCHRYSAPHYLCIACLIPSFLTNVEQTGSCISSLHIASAARNPS